MVEKLKIKASTREKSSSSSSSSHIYVTVDHIRELIHEDTKSYDFLLLGSEKDERKTINDDDKGKVQTNDNSILFHLTEKNAPKIVRKRKSSNVNQEKYPNDNDNNSSCGKKSNEVVHATNKKRQKTMHVNDMDSSLLVKDLIKDTSKMNEIKGLQEISNGDSILKETIQDAISFKATDDQIVADMDEYD